MDMQGTYLRKHPKVLPMYIPKGLIEDTKPVIDSQDVDPAVNII
jgi:hypothetical protein